MGKFLIPMDGLLVEHEWQVGPVVFVPTGWSGLDDLHENPFKERLTNHKWAMATVEAADIAAAYRITSTVVDALTVFIKGYAMSKTMDFGMPGVLASDAYVFARLDGEKGLGVRRVGAFPGLTIGTEVRHEWSNSVWGSFVEPSLKDAHTEGARRAILGIEFLGRAWREEDAAIQAMLLTMALEALLTANDAGGGRYSFSRTVAYMTCQIPISSPAYNCLKCPCVRESPNGPALKRIKSWIGGEEQACSSWIHAIDLYMTRSAIVHGEPTEMHAEIVSSRLWTTSRYALPRILEWLMLHPTDPVGDLERRLDNIDSAS